MTPIIQEKLDGEQVRVPLKSPGPWHGIRNLRFPGGPSPYFTAREIETGQVKWQNLDTIVKIVRRVMNGEKADQVVKELRPQEKLPGI